MREMITRAMSGAVYVAILIFCTLYSPWTLYALFFIFMLISIFEFKKLVTLTDNWIYVSTILFFGSLIHFGDVNFNGYIYISVLSLFVPLIIQLFKRTGENSQVGNFYLAFFYIVISFVLLTKIPFLIDYNTSYDPMLLVGLFIIVWTNDTFAYLVGKSIGKHKLMERISPKKTIEGFVGGLIFALVAAFLLYKYTGLLALENWLVLGVITVVFGTIGDLVESKFKREAGVKDSGSFIPGHGGILDRLDSVIFAAPFVFYYLMSIQN
jgi:phosphatidate cytidylyltransferase